jgi:hypothetical protein
MQTINMTSAVTGKTSVLVLNERINVGETFRIIGRDVAFVARKVFAHKLAGEMVEGISACGGFRTAARVCDTAKLAA